MRLFDGMSDRMRAILMRTAAAFLGVALLTVVLLSTDLSEVGTHLSRVGWGVVLMIAAYQLAFALDSWAWLMTVRSLPGRAIWVWRLWLVRMVGEAVNNATPFAGMGGEPVKAAILNRTWGIGYGEGLASIVLSRTTFLIGLVPFLLIGFALLLAEPAVETSFKWAAGTGLVGLCAGIAAFFAIQRLGLTSRTGGSFARLLDRPGLGRLFETIGEFETRLNEFYAHARLRFSATVLLSFLNWTLGALEIWIAFELLGAPVTFAEAWIIEAVVQLVRVVVFFIPLSLGTQEGAFVLVVGALTGNPALGVAAAVLRRFRELAVLGAGLLMGPLVFGRGALSPAPEKAAGTEREDTTGNPS
ncbi:MAG: lysylphosphatidylglycerol synthase transmembrane domain-containing protein [Rhodospirillaceae bacterium]